MAVCEKRSQSLFIGSNCRPHGFWQWLRGTLPFRVHHAQLNPPLSARPPGHSHPAPGTAQTRHGCALQWLWSVLPGRALSTGCAAVAQPHRALQSPAMGWACAPVPLRCPGPCAGAPGLVQTEGVGGAPLDCCRGGLRLRSGTRAVRHNGRTAFFYSRYAP